MFKMALVIRDESKLSPVDIDGEGYSEELDNELTVLSDVCDALHEINAVAFNVAGFGQDVWPVDVRTDLLTILDQIPDALSAMRCNEQFTLDFFEQGIERKLTFIILNDQRLTVRCTSRTEWVPDPVSYEMPKSEMQFMKSQLARQFLRLSRQVCPKLVRHPYFFEWIKQLRLKPQS